MTTKLEHYAVMCIGAGFTSAMVGLAATSAPVFLAGAAMLILGCGLNFWESVK